jgi:hypothetical protein
MSQVDYKRLTRAHLRSGFTVAVASRVSLWLGPDHVLMIDSTGYRESYKRFYFRDIQAFTIALSQRRLFWNYALGVAASLCVMGWGSYLLVPGSAPSLGMIIVAVVMTLIFALPLLINNLLGPTCICHVQTAVQTEPLPPLNRLRRAQRVIARLRPLVTEAQGVLLSPEQPATPSAETTPVEAVPAPGAPANPQPAVDDPNAPPRIAT